MQGSLLHMTSLETRIILIGAYLSVTQLCQLYIYSPKCIYMCFFTRINTHPMLIGTISVLTQFSSGMGRSQSNFESALGRKIVFIEVQQ